MLNHSNTSILYRYKHSDVSDYYSDRLIKSFIANLALYRAFHGKKKSKAISNIIGFILEMFY